MVGALLASAVAATLTAAGWHSMWPTSQFYGPTFIGLERGSRLLALTYDDGPNKASTPQLLEVLAKNDVRATFFMLGRHVTHQPDLAREVAAAGHAIGNHTYTHPNLIFASPAQVSAQIEACHRVLNDVVGEHSNLFRPPFGGRRPDVLAEVRRRGFVPVMWAISAYDWNRDSAEVIESRVSRRIRGGEVVLMHDGSDLGMGADRSASVAATDRLIRRFKDQGYSFVTVPEMMRSDW
ncbi:MAG TPA: polysaccharide deacetylase family protein [Terriglobales bacterium]|nr:polysaccharide deacetylase family protein [Terriglobales bacterium]